MTLKSFSAKLTAAARKAGVDISALTVLEVTIDRTWGDLCGFAFHGPVELTDRAATYAVKIASTQPSSYGCQNATSDRGVITVHIPVAEARGLGYETQYEHGSHPVTLRCVAINYYPCAE